MVGIEVCCEVLPGGVCGLDERELSGAGPVLALLLAGDGVVDVLETLEVDETGDVCSGRCRYRVSARGVA